MQYIYKENPLSTVVVLDENEKKLFWQTIKTQLLEELVFEIHFSLNNSSPDIENAKNNADINYLLKKNKDKKTQIDIDTDSMFKTYISSLNSEHCGDCTCVPASCLKCSAEEILGINTLGNFSKTYGSMIQSVFTKVSTVDDAIKFLSLEPNKNEHFENVSQEKWDSIKKDLLEKNKKLVDSLREYAREKLKQ